MVRNTNPETADPPSTDKPVVWEYFGYPLESRCDPNCGQSRYHYTPNLRLYIHCLSGSLFLFSHVSSVTVLEVSACGVCHQLSRQLSTSNLKVGVPSSFLAHHPPASVLTLLHGPPPPRGHHPSQDRQLSPNWSASVSSATAASVPPRGGFSARLCQTFFDL